ncbi:MAG: hypothetical protein JW909_14115 [Planctomycetes bacterium]|nr:hypothetical protein [Planctomycetota bacterium]
MRSIYPAAAMLVVLAAAVQTPGGERKPGRAEIRKGPDFPRIANCYGARISAGSAAAEVEFVAKYDLCIGGFWGVDAADPEKVEKLKGLLCRLKEANPKSILLDFSCSAPYVRVNRREGFPEDGFLLQPDGSRINGWPGTEMIDLTNEKVLDWLAERCEDSVKTLGFDGAFIDCMGPRFDGWACEIATGKAWSVDLDHDGKAEKRSELDGIWREAKERLAAKIRERLGAGKVFMGNQAGEGNFERVNGILFEDNLDYVLDGGADWRDIVTRYLHWTRTPCRPSITTIVSSSGIEPPYEMWRLPKEEQEAYCEKGRKLLRRMRFGLATTLLGDGYFAYDLHTRARGQHWWYDEYDAPLGYPRAEGKEYPDGTWRRDFDGGTSVVNPTIYDVEVKTAGRMRDVSSGKVSRRFIVPSLDGRILARTREREREGAKEPDPKPLFTRDGPEKTVERDGKILYRLENGWRALFGADGTLATMDCDRRLIAMKVRPVIVSSEAWKDFAAAGASHEAGDGELSFSGRRTEGEKAIGYVMRWSDTGEGIRLGLEMTAESDVHVHAMRVQVDFPVEMFAGGRATAPDQDVKLPAEKKTSAWMADDFTDMLVADGEGRTRVRVLTSRNAVLRDERVYGGSSYRMSVEFPGGDYKAGRKWEAAVELRREK